MVVDPHGPPCPCGRRGCWERYASGSGLGQLGRAAALARRASRIVALAGGDPESVHGEHVTRAAAEGDPEAVEVLAQFAWWVALGIANLVDLLDPEVVVVGGGLIEAGDLLLDPLRAAYPSLVLAADHRPPARIVAAELGESAGAIGAALLAPT
jgi:glucokinase